MKLICLKNLESMSMKNKLITWRYMLIINFSNSAIFIKNLLVAAQMCWLIMFL